MKKNDGSNRKWQVTSHILTRKIVVAKIMIIYVLIEV